MPDNSAAQRRASRHIQSTRSRYDLLVAHVDRKAPLDTRLFQGCCSQGALANVDAADLGIQPMSLNTLKTISEDFIAGGFRELDRLRRIAARTRSKSTATHSSDATTSSQQPTESEAEVHREHRQKLIDSCAFMADQYGDLLSMYRRALDRLDTGRADPANERRLLEIHLKRFRGPRAQPLTLVGANDSQGPRNEG